MVTSKEQLVLFIRSNRTLGIVCLTGAMVIALNYLLWQSASDLMVARLAYRVMPTAPIVVVTNLGKVLAAIAHIVLGRSLWRMRRDLSVRDGKRWPSVALAANCFASAAAFFCDVAVIFLPVYVLRAAVVNIAAWSTLSTAILFPIWLLRYRVEITKE